MESLMSFQLGGATTGLHPPGATRTPLFGRRKNDPDLVHLALELSEQLRAALAVARAMVESSGSAPALQLASAGVCA